MRLGRYRVVAIALHASPKHIKAFLAWLGLNRSDVPERETEWKPIHREQQDIGLPLGRGARKNVHAHLIVPQLLERTFRFAGAQIERRRDVYTQHEARAHGSAVKAGSPKLDAEGLAVWKECLVLQFDTSVGTEPRSIAPKFAAMLGATIWKRCRIVEQFPDRGKPGIAIVELSGPQLDRPQKSRVLTLKHDGGFSCLELPKQQLTSRPK